MLYTERIEVMPVATKTKAYKYMLKTHCISWVRDLEVLSLRQKVRNNHRHWRKCVNDENLGQMETPIAALVIATKTNLLYAVKINW